MWSYNIPLKYKDLKGMKTWNLEQNIPTTHLPLLFFVLIVSFIYSFLSKYIFKQTQNPGLMSVFLSIP